MPRDERSRCVSFHSSVGSSAGNVIYASERRRRDRKHTGAHRLIPAWTALDRLSISALLTRGLRVPEALHVAALANPEEIVGVPIIRATRLMIERAQATGGLTLTKGGALSRADVRNLFELTEWPDFDRGMVLAVNKVLNEEDVMPILFTRLMARQAGLLRPYKGRLLATKRARELVQPSRASGLFQAAFETVFWRSNLAFLDRLPGEHWPQTHIGVVLWCLSVIAHDWHTPDELAASCTMPDQELDAAAPDLLGFAMVSRVLRPLTWFGLMDLKEMDGDRLPIWRRDRHYRKTPLFDRVLSFSISLGIEGKIYQ